jgi:hypothetical protein
MRGDVVSRTRKDRAQKPRRKPVPIRSTKEDREKKYKRDKGKPPKDELQW